jgi:hypothetical protein
VCVRTLFLFFFGLWDGSGSFQGCTDNFDFVFSDNFNFYVGGFVSFIHLSISRYFFDSIDQLMKRTALSPVGYGVTGIVASPLKL